MRMRSPSLKNHPQITSLLLEYQPKSKQCTCGWSYWTVSCVWLWQGGSGQDIQMDVIYHQFIVLLSRLRCCATSSGRTIPKTWSAVCSVSRRAAEKMGLALAQGWKFYCQCHDAVLSSNSKAVMTCETGLTFMCWLKSREAALWDGHGAHVLTSI